MARADLPPRTVEHNDDGKDSLTIVEKRVAVKSVAERLYPPRLQGDLVLSLVDALGTTDSGHDVFFARSSNPNLPNHLPGAIAIKRFRSPEAASRELSNLRAVEARGFRTVQPAGEGVYPLRNELGTALVTEKLPHLTTMNHVGWQDAQVGEPSYEPLARTLRSVGAFAGQLHGAGIAHGDFQIKNVGQVPPKEFVVFDVEKADFLSSAPTAEERHTFSGKCYEDMRKLTLSLIERRFLEGALPSVLERELTDHLIMPYLENGGDDSIMDLYDELMSEVGAVRDKRKTTSPYMARAALNV